MTAKGGRRLGCFLAIALTFIATPAAAARASNPVCGPRQVIVDFLSEQFQEKPEAIGVSKNGLVLEIYVSTSGTWTIVMSSPKGTACMVDAGHGWLRNWTVPTPNERRA